LQLFTSRPPRSPISGQLPVHVVLKRQDDWVEKAICQIMVNMLAKAADLGHGVRINGRGLLRMPRDGLSKTSHVVLC
jgi:hypothetical protein